MEKLFSKEDLTKIKTGNFDIPSLRENGVELTACSFNKDCTGDILTAYIVKYNVRGRKIEDVFVAFGEKISGDSIGDCVNNSRKFLRNKRNVIIDTRGVSYGAIDILENDYLTDEGVLYKGISSEHSNNRFATRVIPASMTTSYTHSAITKLRDFIKNGYFHVDSKLYEETLKELSLVEYETKDDGIILIHCNNREYIDNILLICETNELLKNER